MNEILKAPPVFGKFRLNYLTKFHVDPVCFIKLFELDLSML